MYIRIRATTARQSNTTTNVSRLNKISKESAASTPQQLSTTSAWYIGIRVTTTRQSIISTNVSRFNKRLKESAASTPH